MTEPIPNVSFISLYFRYSFFQKMCRTLRDSSNTFFENDLISYDPELKALMRAFFIEYGGDRRGSPGIGSKVIIDSIVIQLAVCLIRR